MVTDIVGYTTMAQRDESLALELLEEHRSILRTQFGRHRGREIKTMGDGFLVEFSSAVDAVHCAIDIQQTLHLRNTGLPEEKHVLLRIGVHVGDVVHQEGDLLGDGMNVASRIEPLARPGGVCLSAQVYEHVWNKSRLPFASLGRPVLKHVRAPVEVYRVVFPWEEQPELPAEPTRLAVLPLTNVSPSPEDSYFADGMTGELIYALSRLPSIRVIAQTSTMKYKDSRKSVAEIGRELNVGTVIEGSVRKADHRLRITLQVVDARTEEPLWSEAYDRKLEDVFALQSEIAQQVAEVLEVQLLGKDKPRAGPHPTPNVEAYMLYLQGRYFWNRRTEEGVRRAAEFFEEALRIDSGYASAYAGLADTYVVLINWGYTGRHEVLTEARRATETAIALDPNLAEAHASLGAVLMEERDDPSLAEQAFRRAIELNPSYASAHHWLANLLRNKGQTAEALEEILKALHLDPLSPTIATVAGDLLHRAGRYDEALHQWHRALELAPGFVPARVNLAHAYEAVGNWELAGAELKHTVEANPDSLLALAEYGGHLLRVGEGELGRALLVQAATGASSPFPVHQFGLALVLAGEVATARSVLDRIREQDNDWPELRLALILGAALTGKHDDALQQLDELSGRYSEKLARLHVEIGSFRSLLLALAGRRSEALASLNKRTETDKSMTSKTLLGLTLLWLGEAEQGWVSLSEAVREREALVRMTRVLPLPAALRKDPRYLELLRSLNLPVERPSAAIG